MGEFFKPWRRKIGVMTLVMACLFTAGWVRSVTLFEDMTIPLDGDTNRERLTGRDVFGTTRNRKRKRTVPHKQHGPESSVTGELLA